MTLAIRIAQRQTAAALAQGVTSAIFGVPRSSDSARPSALQVQVKRNAGTSAHSVTIEGSNDLTGPWAILATITDEAPAKITNVPPYVRATAGTATGGTVDVRFLGSVN